MFQNEFIHPTAIIYPDVRLGKNVNIAAYCIIGEPTCEKCKQTTIIGEGSKIRSHTIIYSGNKIGEKFTTGHHVVIRENNQIGDNVSIGTLSCVEHHVKIEDGVRIHSQAFIPEYSVLKENAWIGPNAVLTNAKYPKSKNVKSLLSGVTVGKNALIGANVTILPGITIGEKSLIGSGTVVTENIKPGSVAVGNPAKIINKISNIIEYEL